MPASGGNGGGSDADSSATLFSYGAGGGGENYGGSVGAGFSGFFKIRYKNPFL